MIKSEHWKRNETWKPIVGYEGLYEISSFGRVKSLQNTRGIGEIILKPYNSNGGYLVVGLKINRVVKTVKIHRLVALHFVDNPSNKRYVNHKNKIRTDNRATNLEWVTSTENACHKFIDRSTSSRYRGVKKSKSGKWQAYIRVNGKVKSLGVHADEDQAHQVYLQALKHHGIENQYAVC